MTEQTTRFDFLLRGLPGYVAVTFGRNTEPEALGCRASSRGFPVCRAVVNYAGDGYAAILGWIQLVRSTDNASLGARFEPDPVEAIGVTPHPFAWFGLTPTLFDAPSRTTKDDLDWVAHSVLAFVGGPFEARALMGFAWGFKVAARDISLVEPAPLEATRWDEHLSTLRQAHPTWTFAAGYRHD